MSTSILLGYDQMGELLAQSIADAVRDGGLEIEVCDAPATLEYPDVALAVSKRVLAGDYHSGILVCGTGLGMSISANKINGIRAARCSDVYSVEKARRNSAANILALGSEITTPQQCRALVETWLRYDFDSDRSISKLKRLTEIEELERSNG